MLSASCDSSRFGAVPKVVLLMTSWDWLLFDGRMQSLGLPYPRSRPRTGSIPFLIGEKCFNFVSSRVRFYLNKKTKKKSSGSDKSDRAPVKYSPSPLRGEKILILIQKARRGRENNEEKRNRNWSKVSRRVEIDGLLHIYNAHILFRCYPRNLRHFRGKYSIFFVLA